MKYNMIQFFNKCIILFSTSIQVFSQIYITVEERLFFPPGFFFMSDWHLLTGMQQYIWTIRRRGKDDGSARQEFFSIHNHTSCVWPHTWLSISSLGRLKCMDNAFSYVQFFLLTCSLDFIKHFIVCCVEKKISLYGKIMN